MESVDLSDAAKWVHWLSVLRNIGALLVLLGVAFEFGGDWFSEPFQKKIDDARTLELARLGKEAASARAEIATAQTDAARANERAAEASRVAEEEKLARVRIEAQLAPRRITPEQAERIVVKMKEWAALPHTNDRQRVAVFPTSTSFESAALADQIANILGESNAGWNVNRNAVTMGNPMTVRGIGMFTSSNERGNILAEALASALNDEGVLAFVIPQKWRGCEDRKISEHPDTDPYCSSFSVMVGDHP